MWNFVPDCGFRQIFYLRYDHCNCCQLSSADGRYHFITLSKLASTIEYSVMGRMLHIVWVDL